MGLECRDILRKLPAGLANGYFFPPVERKNYLSLASSMVTALGAVSSTAIQCQNGPLAPFSRLHVKMHAKDKHIKQAFHK